MFVDRVVEGDIVHGTNLFQSHLSTVMYGERFPLRLVVEKSDLGPHEHNHSMSVHIRLLEKIES